VPYFPPAEPPKPYYCPNCKAWFYYSNMSCLVMHGPGSCCHHYEQKAPAPTPPTFDIIKRA
jgi:hypothetical protein